mgnify:CR=1 FL=1
MPKQGFDCTRPLAVVAVTILIGILSADIFGRIRDLLISEWPHISWGLLILSIAIPITWIFTQFLNIHDRLEAALIEKTSALQKLSDGIRNSVAQLERRMESISDRCGKDIRELERLNNLNAKKIEELSEQKMPHVPNDIQFTDPALAEAAEEFSE